MSVNRHDIDADDMLVTNEWSWFLGFLWADGTISDKLYSLEIKATDFDDIWDTLYQIGFRSNSYRIRQNKYYQKSVTSSKGVENLKKWGYREKSVKPPSFIWNLLTDAQKVLFLRGLFEGDGSYAKYNTGTNRVNKLRITMNGPVDYDWAFILDFFNQNKINPPCIERKTRIQNNKERSYSIVTWCKKESVKKIFNLLYKDNLSIGLLRKRSIALKYLNEHYAEKDPN